MKPNIVMQSDFGTDSGLVSCMHGICKQVDAELSVYDITHVIRPFDIVQASETLQYTIICWPKGTVFVSVVDPGVGTKRRAAVAKTKNGYYIVTPDNGALTWVDKLYGIEAVREIDESVNRYTKSEFVDIFHGRDLFSYTAARLASGVIAFEGVGPSYPVEEIVKHALHCCEIFPGKAVGIATGDPENGFGGMGTNIPNAEFIKTGITFGDDVRLTLTLAGETVFEKTVRYGRTFGDVAAGEVIVHPEIASFIGFAVNMGSFAASYGIRANEIYGLTIEKIDA